MSLPGGRDITTMTEIKVGSYNMLNLMYHQGKHVPTGIDQYRPIAGEFKQIDKPMEHILNSAKAIKENNFDFFWGQEVEGIDVARDYSKRFLDDEYIPLFIKANDTRNIQVGVFIKRDLPFDVELHSFQRIKGNYLGNDIEVFSRDLAVLLVYPKNHKPGDKPIFITTGGHFKSMRDTVSSEASRATPVDPGSALRRKVQFETTLKIKKILQEKYGDDIPFMMSADNNTDVNGPEISTLTGGGLVDSFKAAQTPFNGSVVTHTYHPREKILNPDGTFTYVNGPVQARQIDAQFIDEKCAEKGLVKSAGVYRYKDAAGSELPIPQTFDQRKMNPSDHFPIWMVLDFKKVLEGCH
jgi:hypothetical protein